MKKLKINIYNRLMVSSLSIVAFSSCANKDNETKKQEKLKSSIMTVFSNEEEGGKFKSLSKKDQETVAGQMLEILQNPQCLQVVWKQAEMEGKPVQFGKLKEGDQRKLTKKAMDMISSASAEGSVAEFLNGFLKMGRFQNLMN